MTERSGQGFPRERRLRRAADFQRVYQGKIYASDSVLVITAARNSLGQTRLGLSVSRVVGRAVVRNRWKRLIREAFRQSRTRLPAGVDLIVRPRRGATPEFRSVSESLVRLSQQVAKRVK